MLNLTLKSKKSKSIKIVYMSQHLHQNLELICYQ